MNNKNRWYDRYLDLGFHIERLKSLKKKERDKIILDIKDIIMDYDDKLIDRNVFDFSLSLKRRWYDKDPFSWMVINALLYADETLLNKVTDFLRGKLQ
jgi:hypothetical protein